MTEFPIPVSQPSVGRPPLSTKPENDTKPTQVRLTAQLRARIAKVAGPNRMAIFIREAIENELERREQGGKPPASDP